MKNSNTQKLLLKEEKGATFRALNLETNKELRIFQRDFPNIDLIVGSLLTVTDLEVGGGNLVMNMTVINEVLGDSTKDRVEVCIDEYKIGDLVDGVPILNFGVCYAKKGKKMAYAYFKNRR